ncbi:MAG TPA: adenosylmethionine--8-amino-7-oxononanoate transaminase [Candidatus Nitrosopolaris sp.]|nr:adenosylmethionine--8-amino-7-oxononanoate transaminase [Candidatus Nitrosopolaris sp.]
MRLAHADKRYIWHPYTQMKDWKKWDNRVIIGGKGFYLIDNEGRRYLDGIASMWCNVWGHGRNEIVSKMSEQIQTLQHSTLFGLANAPSITLAEKLLNLARGMQSVFYSDNGSTALEVAMKMAVQYWRNKGKPKKTHFIGLEHAYHGDTLGAMSLGYLAKYFRAYKPILAKVYRAPSPWENGSSAKSIEDIVDRCIEQTEHIIVKYGYRCAALVMESGAQIAGGGIIFEKGYQQKVSDLCKKHDLLLIVDEIATGFGRLGNMIEYLAQRSSPDIVCFGKALTAGYSPLAVTLTTEDIYNAFLGNYSERKQLNHGHTFTGHPIACAAAIANLDLYKRHNLLQKIRENSQYIGRRLEEVSTSPIVSSLRHKGLLAAFELYKNNKPINYMQNKEPIQYFIMRESMKMGVFLRSLANTMIVIPPLAIPRRDLKTLLDVHLRLLQMIERESK